MKTKLRTLSLIVFGFSVLTACKAQGQEAVPITVQQFAEIKLNGQHELQALVDVAGDWNQLKSLLGNPITESCDTTFVNTSCRFSWDGMVALYVDRYGDFELNELTLSGTVPYLEYGAETIRVGDSISKIQQLFPAAHAERGEVCGEEICESSAAIRPDGDETNSVAFYYDSATGAIQRIEYFRFTT